LDQQIFLEFEYVSLIAISLVIFLMYLFYVRYPYGSETDEKAMKSGEEP
jgi:hypothetical protein